MTMVLLLALCGQLPPVIEVPTTVTVQRVVPGTPRVVTEKRTVRVPRTVYEEVELEQQRVVVPAPTVETEELETTVPYVPARPRAFLPLLGGGPYLLAPQYDYSYRARSGRFGYRSRERLNVRN